MSITADDIIIEMRAHNKALEERITRLEKLLPKFKVGDKVVRKDGRPSVVKEVWSWMYKLEGGDSKPEYALTMQEEPKIKTTLAERLQALVIALRDDGGAAGPDELCAILSEDEE